MKREFRKLERNIEMLKLRCVTDLCYKQIGYKFGIGYSAARNACIRTMYYLYREKLIDKETFDRIQDRILHKGEKVIFEVNSRNLHSI